MSDQLIEDFVQEGAEFDEAAHLRWIKEKLEARDRSRNVPAYDLIAEFKSNCEDHCQTFDERGKLAKRCKKYDQCVWGVRRTKR